MQDHPAPLSGPRGGQSEPQADEPLQDAAPPAPEKRKRRKRKLPKIISRQEAAALLAAADDGTDVGVRNRCMLEVMYCAALRVSEVCALGTRDVEDEGVIRVYDAKGGDGTAYFNPARLLPTLERWRAIRKSWGVEHETLLFVHPDGGKISTRYMQRLMVKLKAQCGIVGKCTPHVLRHTFATEHLERGDLNLTEIQALLRHANLATTAVYLHVRDESLRRKMSLPTEGVP